MTKIYAQNAVILARQIVADCATQMIMRNGMIDFLAANLRTKHGATAVHINFKELK